ncbi:helix-turn-helix transcriptional regulator [Actinoplanes solisilvae]|uniref:helix-turn-helix transcriptional regulator n=1 Tax=Actinoplanes solisilvae TaxID=2486853 RepID=UPI000FD72ADB|nr:helix-turn-helix transcriptional regulator [Actinoplanes solisilvae]
MTISTESRRAEMADFLRRRREALAPGDVGITVRDRRRTPGLRRDEVAARAHMSAVYYERLERGRGPVPSAAALGGLARALRLTADESEYLYRLAGQTAPALPEPPGFIDPGLLSALAAVSPSIPATITDELGTVVAQNSVNTALFGPIAGLGIRTANIVWRWFTEPSWRHWLEETDQHELTSRAYVADLRAVLARRADDPVVPGFVAALHEASEEFTAVWREHAVSALHCPRKRIDDERVGRLELDCTMMLSAQSSQRLMLLQPVPGTGTDERLAQLHKLTAA